MFKKLITATLVLVMCFSLTACAKGTETADGNEETAEACLPTKAANPDIITEVKAANGEVVGVALDIGTYESFDEEAALSLLESKYGRNMGKSGCTCVVKDRSDDGEGLLIGRNMDFSLSDRPLYKFQLNYGKP